MIIIYSMEQSHSFDDYFMDQSHSFDDYSMVQSHSCDEKFQSSQKYFFLSLIISLHNFIYLLQC